ncbi:hypothetical protein J6590_090466 [Homalodisca vitripennis]|nr:hypothetical protein J6590_090466 [Homalodisca vitripennis]
MGDFIFVVQRLESDAVSDLTPGIWIFIPLKRSEQLLKYYSPASIVQSHKHCTERQHCTDLPVSYRSTNIFQTDIVRPTSILQINKQARRALYITTSVIQTDKHRTDRPVSYKPTRIVQINKHGRHTISYRPNSIKEAEAESNQPTITLQTNQYSKNLQASNDRRDRTVTRRDQAIYKEEGASVLVQPPPTK